MSIISRERETILHLSLTNEPLRIAATLLIPPKSPPALNLFFLIPTPSHSEHLPTATFSRLFFPLKPPEITPPLLQPTPPLLSSSRSPHLLFGFGQLGSQLLVLPFELRTGVFELLRVGAFCAQLGRQLLQLTRRLPVLVDQHLHVRLLLVQLLLQLEKREKSVFNRWSRLKSTRL